MKKNIALLLGLVLALGFVSCSSDDDENEKKLAEDGNGMYLAEMVITISEWIDDKCFSEGEPYSITRYNKDGQAVSYENSYDGYREDITYFENGDLKEEKVYSLDSTLISTYKYEYFLGGQTVFKYHYNWKNKLVSTLKSEYDNDKRLIRETQIIDSIGKNRGMVMSYSYSGNTRTIELSDLDGSILETETEETDSHGNLVKSTITEYENTCSFDHENEYDSKGRILSTTVYRGDKHEFCKSTGYTYNDDGTIKKVHWIFTRSVHLSREIVESVKEIIDHEYTYIYKKK